MKKLLLPLLICLSSLLGFSQNCAKVVSSSIVTSATGENLLMNYTVYTADGQKHIEYYIYCDGSLILHDCFSTFKDGSQLSPAFTCPGVITYDLITATGTCGHGTTCDTIHGGGPSGGPTPVTLASFSAQRNSGNVLLSWNSSQELGLSSYEIQRAEGNSTYRTVGTVRATNLNTYTYADNSNSSKVVTFYRLKMLDANGRYTFSGVKAVKGKNATLNFTVFPNPSFGNSKVTITDLHEPTTLQVIDNVGRVVRSVTLASSSSVDLNGLPQGSYKIFLRGIISNETSVRSLNVIK